MAEKIEIPYLPVTSRVLTVAENVGERAWRVFGKTLAGQLILGSGSTSPALVEVKWNDCPQLDPEDVDWCEIAGDPEAGIGKLPRHWENVAVIGSDRDSLPCGKDPLGWARDGVICLSEGRVKIGTKPDSYKLFGADDPKNGEHNGKTQAVLAICRGRGLIKAAPVMVEPDGEVIIPEDTSVIKGSLPTGQVSRYPGISLVQVPPLS